jgi:scyllo-inositol 2-dehydrogenase (NADP+)
VVSTPSGTHFDLARQALKAGKNVVVDKPVAVTSAEVAELMHLAAKKNLLFVAFPRTPLGRRLPHATKSC